MAFLPLHLLQSFTKYFYTQNLLLTVNTARGICTTINTDTVNNIQGTGNKYLATKMP